MDYNTTNTFLGMKIITNYRDMNDPKLEIDYNKNHCEFSLREMDTIKGKLPGRAMNFVIEWVEANIDDIEDNHLRVIYGRPLKQLRSLV